MSDLFPISLFQCSLWSFPSPSRGSLPVLLPDATLIWQELEVSWASSRYLCGNLGPTCEVVCVMSGGGGLLHHHPHPSAPSGRHPHAASCAAQREEPRSTEVRENIYGMMFKLRGALVLHSHLLVALFAWPVVKLGVPSSQWAPLMDTFTVPYRVAWTEEMDQNHRMCTWWPWKESGSENYWFNVFVGPRRTQM